MTTNGLNLTTLNPQDPANQLGDVSTNLIGAANVLQHRILQGEELGWVDGKPVYKNLDTLDITDNVTDGSTWYVSCEGDTVWVYGDKVPEEELEVPQVAIFRGSDEDIERLYDRILD